MMDKDKKKKFEPLIQTSKTQKTTLQDKEVNIKDTMNFERHSDKSLSPPPTPVIITDREKREQNRPDKEEMERCKEKLLHNRRTTMKTQKMSLDVLSKLEILDPFLRSAEKIETDRKISINEKIDILINSYLNYRLSTRQIEGFKAIYDSYLEENIVYETIEEEKKKSK